MLTRKVMPGMFMLGALTLTSPGSPLWAQSGLSDRVDAYVARHMASEGIPGMAVAVIKAGRVVHAKGYGLANVEHQVPVTTRTVFQSGSVGKVFTVMAVMMLVDEGSVRLEDPLTRWFPDAPDSWRAVTVRNLLEHTSGLPGYPADFDFRRDRTEAELYELIKAQPLEFAVGERRGYSNLGFVLLGIMIRKATGLHYGDVLQQRIFGPLQMTTARVISEADIVPNRAAGYQLIDSRLTNQEWVAPSLNTTADGAIYLSLEDMAKWEAALHRGDLLSAQSYEKVWSRLVTNDGMPQPWGLSWWVGTINGQWVVEHSGGWQGFVADFVRYPAAEMAVAVFLNRSGVSPVEPARRVLEIYRPELSIAGARVIPEVDQAALSTVRNLVTRIADKTLTPEMFAGTGGDDILPHQQQAADEFRAFGPLRRAELVSREELPRGVRLLQYRLTFDARQVVLILTLDEKNHITALDMRR